MTILITGASGVTGQAIIRKLAGKSVTPLAMTSRKEGAAALEALGARPVVGNLYNSASLETALRGVERVYHICPVLNVDEHAIGKRIIAAAEKAGVRHFVFHSVAGSLEEDVPFHWEKLKVERELLHSTLPYTVIQPTCNMQNIEWAWPFIRRTGQFGQPYSPDSPITWVDREDIAEAAANILTETGHEYGTYQLAGDAGPLTCRQIAALISKKFGRPVEAVRLDPNEIYANPRFANFSRTSLDWGITMFKHFDKHGFTCGNNKILKMLIGREPRTFANYLDRETKIHTDAS